MRMQLVAPGRRLAAFSFSLAFFRASVASASNAEPVIVVTVSANAPELDPALLRDAIGRELRLEAVGPDDDRAPRARGYLDVSLDRPTHALVVTYRGGAEPLVRHVDLPSDREATTRVVAMLAGNLGRDEAGELTESLRTETEPTTTPDTPRLERAEKERRVLAQNRLEFRPLGGWSIAPNSVTGAFVGADVAFRMGRFFALGVDAAWYAPFNGSAGVHPSYPLNESRWSADLDAYVVPWPARAGTSTAMGAFEPYVLGGLGVLAYRPIPVVDPANRHFGDSNAVDLAFGVGVRLFLLERLAIALEVRDLIYFTRMENNAVAGGSTTLPLTDPNNPKNPVAWYSPNTRLTNSVQVRLSANLFVF
jgi:hypothetical protein